SDSASSATPSTASAPHSEPWESPRRRAPAAMNRHPATRLSADVAVNYCRQDGERPRQSQLWRGLSASSQFTTTIRDETPNRSPRSPGEAPTSCRRPPLPHPSAPPRNQTLKRSPSSRRCPISPKREPETLAV